MIYNISTGSWSETNIYVSAATTAQLSNNFSTSTGGIADGFTVNGTLICPATWQVNGSGTFTLNSGATLKIAAPGGANDAITTSGTVTLDPEGHYVFNGLAAQVTGSIFPALLGPSGTLTIDNSTGVTLSQLTTVNGSLIFLSGILYTGPFLIAVIGGVVGAGPVDYVNGTLVKPVLSSSPINYEVGDASYAPLRLSFSTATPGGGIGVRAVAGIHPAVSASQLTSADMVNHFWTITNAGATVTGIIPTATYNAADIIGGSNSSFLTQVYIGGSWLLNPIATTNTSTPYTSAPTSGISGITPSADVIFGNDCGIPIAGPSTACVGTPITLTDVASGTWSSSSAAVAGISSSGVVTGLVAGTAIISYTVPACLAIKVVTVSSLPDAGTITGSDTVCVSTQITLADAAGGGTWSSSDATIATVSATGMVTGVATGSVVITYTASNACGSTTTSYAMNVYSATHCVLEVNAAEVKTQMLDVHPNPNNGNFSVQLISGTNKTVNFDITDITGRIVKSITAMANTETVVNLDNCGLYIITAYASDGEKYVAKTVVAK
jgi:hypothetical protein